MKFHALKCWPPYFRQVRDDLKCLEVRQNDRDYQDGDVLVLQEYLPTDEELDRYAHAGAPMAFNVEPTRRTLAEDPYYQGMDRGYSSEVELVLARHVLREAPGLAEGYVAISLQRVVLAAPDVGEDGPGPN